MEWVKEKAYCRRRAEELKKEMELAISEKNREKFEKAFSTSLRYTTKKERSPYYRRFLVEVIGA